MRKIIIGVMGPGDDATAKDLDTAFELGKLIAKQGWIVLCGGRNAGVMNAVSKGAKSAQGLTIGVIPYVNTNISDGVEIAIITDMGDARNNINVLSSNVVAVCGMNPGTASEVALAIKAKKNIVLLNVENKSIDFFQSLDKKRLFKAQNAIEAINFIQKLVSSNQS